LMCFVETPVWPFFTQPPPTRVVALRGDICH
jgi:hypothetical protein